MILFAYIISMWAFSAFWVGCLCMAYLHHEAFVAGQATPPRDSRGRFL